MQALAQDQLRALLSMTENFEHFDIGVYDGDTSQEERIWLRDNARLVLQHFSFVFLKLCRILMLFSLGSAKLMLIVFSPLLQLITNPDMLHLSILPFHGQFQRILSNLK